MASVVDAMAGVDHTPGVERLRRERRLRAYLWYARMSVAMALAEATHHTAHGTRGQPGPGRRNARCTTRPRSGRQFLLPSRSSLTSSRSLAGGGRLAVGAAGATAGGPAAHRGAHSRYLAVRADSRCACAAVGESGGGIHADARHSDPGAGYRSAQALSRQNSTAFCVTSSAEGRTVGGSADCVVLRHAPAARYRADHRHSSSGSWRWWWMGRSSRLFLRTEFYSTACGAER